MQWSDISFSPSRRMLRQFAGLLMAVSVGFAAYRGFVHGPGGLGMLIGVAGGLIGMLGLVAPTLIRPLFVAWMVVAFPIGWTISRVLLALVFYGLFTPLGLVFKVIGRDRLLRARSPGRDSYWAPKPQPEVRHYYRQF